MLGARVGWQMTPRPSLQGFTINPVSHCAWGVFCQRGTQCLGVTSIGQWAMATPHEPYLSPQKVQQKNLGAFMHDPKHISENHRVTVKINSPACLRIWITWKALLKYRFTAPPKSEEADVYFISMAHWSYSLLSLIMWQTPQNIKGLYNSHVITCTGFVGHEFRQDLTS